MSIVYDRKFRLDGLNMQITMGFADVIFVMEDVDAASDVVKRRDGKHHDSGEFHLQESVDLPTPKSMLRMLMESSATECQALVRELTKKSERLKAAAELLRPEILQTITRRVTAMPGLGLVSEIEKDATLTRICDQALKTSNELSNQCTKLDKILIVHAKHLKAIVDACAELDDVVVDEILGNKTSLSCTISASCLSSVSTIDVADPFDGPSMSSHPDQQRMNMGLAAEGKWDKRDYDKKGFLSDWREDPDKLSLAGLLNVLDGVVDSPGRIIIMTTNHPEKLDPALVRPGRIDKKILLGHMTAPDIVSMLEHFFLTDVSPSQVSRVEAAIRDGLELTPALVEQLAAEHDTIEDMVAVMDSMGRPRIQFKQ
jgi:hypothetical protein